MYFIWYTTTHKKDVYFAIWSEFIENIFIISGIYRVHLKCFWDFFWIWHFWSENFLESKKIRQKRFKCDHYPNHISLLDEWNINFNSSPWHFPLWRSILSDQSLCLLIKFITWLAEIDVSPPLAARSMFSSCLCLSISGQFGHQALVRIVSEFNNTEWWGIHLMFRCPSAF